ncbi:MFS transporter [Mesorhizobium sp. KR9-304]|uniref:MFS transporter n=1 Tax=Mesorhizobium sp. KR9-304 TaxID=3156614 RepID=UPI0032B5C7A3
MDADNPLAVALRGRWAVAAIFFVNGFVTGSWAPQIPVFLTRLDITESTLGLLILLFGAGAVSAMVWAGHLIPKHGSKRVTTLFAISCCFGLLLVALAPTVATAAVAMYLFGGAIGACDVSMNANAVTAERKLGRAIMSSSHGFWSLGGFVGGGAGGIVIQNYGHVAHAAIVSIVAIAIAAAALRHLVADLPVAQEHRTFSLPRNPTVYVIGIMALLCMNSEGAVLDWGALYLRQELGSDIATAGFAFGAFAGAMALMRFVGDGVRNRLGAVATFRMSCIVSAAGMLVAGLSAAIAPWPWLAIGAFAVCGLGIANMVPILFSAAGNQPGVHAGAGVSVVTTMGYSGILAAPSVIGFVGEKTGFAPIFIAIAGLLGLIFLLSGLTRAADFTAGPRDQ